MNKYQKELENLNEARLNINTLCEWLPKPVLDNLEEYGGEYDVYHYVDRSVFQELVDRATSMKVSEYTTYQDPFEPSERYQLPLCPKCKDELGGEYKYCPFCGQKLDWSWDHV